MEFPFSDGFQPTSSLTHATHAFHIPTIMIKVSSLHTKSSTLMLIQYLDMEHEEGRERSGEEEAKDQCCPDSGSERYRLRKLSCGFTLTPNFLS
jgi:hypothetical protein